jgi:D-alanyl-lipoteichoic acid acyltransferase DltB (MBOAT superfamily)
MLFNSLSFLLFFLPLALLGYYSLGLLGHRWAGVWLIIASFVFYTWWTAWLTLLLAGSITFNFTCGALLLRAQGRERLQSFLLTVAVMGDLLLLIYYKYFFSLLNWLGYHGLITLPHPYNLILPLGISFFTFTQIGYLVDCKGGVVKENRLLDYCLFVTFFPHLIAGPILHHREMMPQFAQPETYRFQWTNFSVGGTLFVIGLAKKVLIADYLAPIVGWYYTSASGLPLFRAWDAAFSYSLQLYFDFSGYSDMALGLALLFGMRFPANFNSPYRAASMIDYWQRFHMTLTRYITLYIYSPLALWVSRQRARRGKSIARAAISTPGGFMSMIMFPTFFTVILAGAWHGAGLTFLIFGLLHACYLTINHAWRSFGPRVPKEPPHPVWRWTTDIAKVALTYLAVVVAQVFFRSSSPHDAVRILQGMVGCYGFFGPDYSLHGLSPDRAIPWVSTDLSTPGHHLVKLALLFFIVWSLPNSLQILRDYAPSLTEIRPESPISFRWKPTVAWGIAVGTLAFVALMESTGLTEFLYFRF